MRASCRTLPKPEAPPQPKTPPAPVVKAPLRSEAITLLATLQREARFLDFLMEPLAGYADAQVGAVARDVHRDCGAVVKRLFDPKPAVSQEEGSPLEVPAGFDAGRLPPDGQCDRPAALPRPVGSSRLGSPEMRASHLDRLERVRPRHRPGGSGTLKINLVPRLWKGNALSARLASLRSRF